MDFLMEFTRGATVIMPCHQLHFLHHADLIVTLQDSTVQEQGTFDELMCGGGEFASLMARHAQSSADGDDQHGALAAGSSGSSPVKGQGDSDAATLLALQGAGKAGSLIALEEREIGKIGMKVYSYYARQYTLLQLSPLVFFYLMAQLSQFAMDMWMSRWAVGDRSIVPAALEENPTLWYCSGYAVFGIGTFVFAGLRYIWVQLIGLQASSKLHNLMLGNLLHAPCAFFDVTPVGRCAKGHVLQ
jgi:ABC-type multidrug transport system fused ATPase/permease subunit